MCTAVRRQNALTLSSEIVQENDFSNTDAAYNLHNDSDVATMFRLKCFDIR